jgi:hypothetical protein
VLRANSMIVAGGGAEARRLGTQPQRGATVLTTGERLDALLLSVAERLENSPLIVSDHTTR